MRLITSLFFLLFIAALTLFVLFDIPPFFDWIKKKEPIKVGVVYSTTGFLSPFEIPIQQATLMAIDEINHKGGLLGRKILPILRDAQSSKHTTRKEIENLIYDENVHVIFGRWVTHDRYYLQRILEDSQNLLITPFSYGGIIQSPNLIFMGTTINQQIPPTINYCFENFGKLFFLVGSDVLLSHIMHIMAKDQIMTKEGEILGDFYIPLKTLKFDDVIDAIIQTKPDVILNSLIDDENKVFFSQLRKAGIKADQISVFSFNVNEATIANANKEDFVDSYATWNYFESISSPVNQQFVENFKDYTNLTEVDNLSESGYMSVYLWAKAVEEAKSTDVKSLDEVFDNMRLLAPEGFISMNMEGQSAWRYARIGKVLPDGQFKIIWQSSAPIRPIPYQVYRSPFEWNELADQLYHQFEMR